MRDFLILFSFIGFISTHAISQDSQLKSYALVGGMLIDD